MAPTDRKGIDDGDPHATELATGETGEAVLIVSPAFKCDMCGALLPPDAEPCPGTGELRGAQFALEEIEWRNAAGERVQSKAPRVCVERFRVDGKVSWPRVA